MRKKSLSILSLLLFVFATLSAQRASENYSFLSFWDFKYKGTPDSVDCRFNHKKKKLFLSGFDTDGQGTFYFAGGRPLYISCFKDTMLQWRRKVSAYHTTRALLRLRGDSLYLLHNRTHELIILNKDGTGDVHRVQLETDNIDEGVLHPDYFIVRDREVEHKTESRYWRTSIYSTFNYQGQLMQKDTIERRAGTKVMRPAPKLLLSDGSLSYKGDFRNMHLFTDIMTNRFVLIEDGKPCFAYTFLDRLPSQVFHDEISRVSHFSSPEGEIVRGTHYYYVAYERDGNRLMVVDINLDKMFPDAKNLGE